MQPKFLLMIPDIEVQSNQRVSNLRSYEPSSPARSMPAQFSQQSSSSVSSSVDSAFSLNSIPDSDQNNNYQPSSSTLSVPQSSPPLQPTILCLSPTPTNDIRSSSPPGVIDNTPIQSVRESTTRSFIHFHGDTAGNRSARYWTCNYCKSYFLPNLLIIIIHRNNSSYWF